MRLIDADRLTDEFDDTIGSPFARTRLKLQVQNQPTIDAVEVVRCKDCRYKPVGTGCNHELEFPVSYKCPCECEDYWYSWMPKDDFFCGNGERKETDG